SSGGTDIFLPDVTTVTSCPSGRRTPSSSTTTPLRTRPRATMDNLLPPHFTGSSLTCKRQDKKLESETRARKAILIAPLPQLDLHLEFFQVTLEKTHSHRPPRAPFARRSYALARRPRIAATRSRAVRMAASK